jgi:hypothetical protein
MTELTNRLLLDAVLEIEKRQNAISDFKAEFAQTYTVADSNLLREVLEQRAIAREATEYANALLSAPDLPEDADE